MYISFHLSNSDYSYIIIHCKYFIGQVIVCFITILSTDGRVAKIPNIPTTLNYIYCLLLLSIKIIILFVCNPYFLNNNLVNNLVRVHSPVDTVRVSFYNNISSYYLFNMFSKKRKIDSENKKFLNE